MFWKRNDRKQLGQREENDQIPEEGVEKFH